MCLFDPFFCNLFAAARRFIVFLYVHTSVNWMLVCWNAETKSDPCHTLYIVLLAPVKKNRAHTSLIVADTIINRAFEQEREHEHGTC